MEKSKIGESTIFLKNEELPRGVKCRHGEIIDGIRKGTPFPVAHSDMLKCLPRDNNKLCPHDDQKCDAWKLAKIITAGIKKIDQELGNISC